MKAKYLIEILKQHPEHEVNVVVPYIPYAGAKTEYDNYNINGLVTTHDDAFVFGVDYLGGDEEW